MDGWIDGCGLWNGMEWDWDWVWDTYGSAGLLAMALGVCSGLFITYTYLPLLSDIGSSKRNSNSNSLGLSGLSMDISTEPAQRKALYKRI